MHFISECVSSICVEETFQSVRYIIYIKILKYVLHTHNIVCVCLYIHVFIYKCIYQKKICIFVYIDIVRLFIPINKYN